MISRAGQANFFVAHYDWFVSGVGLLALLAGAAFLVVSIGDDPEAAREEALATVDRMKPAKSGVEALDMETMRAAVKMTRSPLQMTDVSETAESFLASERRVMCKCKKAIPGDVRACPKCPYCGEQQQEEQKVVLDADSDGLPNDWEKKYGLNPNNPADAAEDTDKDGFTNLEEYVAKTDPTDAKDHPDYLDSLKIVLPLQPTYMPFVFTKATKIPAGWRCEFFDAKQKDDYGRPGRTMTSVIGEKVGKTDFVLKSYEQKSEKRAIKGGQGMTKTVDVSEATVERTTDGKVVKLVIAASKKEKPVPVDVQATLVYERGNAQSFDVVSGSTISLNGVKYRVTAVTAVGKGAKVSLEDTAHPGKVRTLEALEQ